MRYRALVLTAVVLTFYYAFGRMADSQEKIKGKIDWVVGYISAAAEGTASPSGNKIKDQLRAIRAATVMAQRSLLETVKGLKIDSQTKIENKIVREDVINTRIEGTIQGAEIVKQTVRWDGDTPIAIVELRICLNGVGVCKSEKSVISALALDQKSEQANAPIPRLDDIVAKQYMGQQNQEINYDPTRPVTGIILNLQGLLFERVILPVVITRDGNKLFTVYSVKSVEPQVIRNYGVVRYADSVEQAKQNSYLGGNVIVIPVSAITRENMVMIGLNAARIIRETTSHGNNYLRAAKVMIAAK